VELNNALETPPAGQIPRPGITPNFTGTANQFNGMGIGGNTATAPGITEPVNINQTPGMNVRGRVIPQFTMDGPAADQPTPPVVQPRPNIRPKFADTGDPVGDAKRYEAEATAYKPENHNGFWRGIGIQALRGLDQGYQRTHSVEGALSGAATGAIAGAVDPTQDEYWYNENVAKPQSRAQVDRALDTQKTEAGIRHLSDEDEINRLKVTDAQQKAKATRAQTALNNILRRGHGFNSKDPNNAAIVRALDEAGVPYNDLPPDIQTVRWVHDAATGEDIMQTVDKNGKVSEPTRGPAYTDNSAASRTVAEKRLERQIAARETARLASEAFQREQQQEREQAQIKLKQTPGAPTPKAPEATDPKYAGKPINMDALFDDAEKMTVPAGPNEDDEDYNRRLQANVNRLVAALLKKGAIAPTSTNRLSTALPGQ